MSEELQKEWSRLIHRMEWEREDQIISAAREVGEYNQVINYRKREGKYE